MAGYAGGIHILAAAAAAVPLISNVTTILTSLRFPQPLITYLHDTRPASTLMSDLSMKVICGSGRVIVTSSVQPMLPDDLNLESTTKTLLDLDHLLTSKVKRNPVDMTELWGLYDPPGTPGDSRSYDHIASELGSRPLGAGTSPPLHHRKNRKRRRTMSHIHSTAVDLDSRTRSQMTAADSTGKWVSARIELPQGRATVLRVVPNYDNMVFNTLYHNYPSYDEEVYIVQYEDGTTSTVNPSTIAAAVANTVDNTGYEWLTFDSIINHYDSQVVLRWKDGTTSIVPIQEAKESYPLQLAQYAQDTGVIDDPPFRTWARFARVSVL